MKYALLMALGLLARASCRLAEPAKNEVKLYQVKHSWSRAKEGEEGFFVNGVYVGNSVGTNELRNYLMAQQKGVVSFSTDALGWDEKLMQFFDGMRMPVIRFTSPRGVFSAEDEVERIFHDGTPDLKSW